VLGLLLAGDVLARVYAQGRLQQAIDLHSAPDERIRAHIHSFPFLWHLVVGQEVETVDASSDVLQEGHVTIRDAAITLKGVKIDRAQLFGHQRVVLRDIDQAKAVASVNADDLSRTLGVPVQISGGVVEVTVAGQRVKAEVSVSNGVITIKVAGLQLPALELPGASLLPCRPDAAVLEDRIRLSCTVHGVPTPLRDLVNGATAAA
jgi:hypothetical protein